VIGMTEYHKFLKIYMPDGAELIYNGKFYDWGDFGNGNNMMEYRIFSKDGKEIDVIKGYFAIKEIITKVEEENKE